MNKKLVAAELLKIARELIALPWQPARRDVDVGLRNYEVKDSLTSYAPTINKIVRTEAAKLLARQDFRIQSLNDLKLEWSEYLALVDPMTNANKYHYYVIYSFTDATNVTRYSAFNCSGRIGIVERVYDLTEKFLGGPVTNMRQAQNAAERHMSTKLAKGYEPVSMVRG